MVMEKNTIQIKFLKGGCKEICFDASAVNQWHILRANSVCTLMCVSHDGCVVLLEVFLHCPREMAFSCTNNTSCLYGIVTSPKAICYK